MQIISAFKLKKPIAERNLKECITSIDFSKDFLAAGLLDEKVYVWYINKISK